MGSEMSGLDDVIKGVAGGQGGGLGSILGGLAGAAGGKAGVQEGGMGGLLAGLVPMLGGMLAGGGLQKVISGLQANGLSAQADSWIAAGENEPISGADIRKVVGDEELTKIASRLGVSEDEAAAAVAKVLPAVVDKVSPDGQLASDSELDSAFRALEELGEGTPETG
jgi:uncharacterized protein YidB (DUF937 family)